jgi:hypothetical protein
MRHYKVNVEPNIKNMEKNVKSTGKYKPIDGLCPECSKCLIRESEIEPNTTGNYIRTSFYCTIEKEYIYDRIIECNYYIWRAIKC